MLTIIAEEKMPKYIIKIWAFCFLLQIKQVKNAKRQKAKRQIESMCGISQRPAKVKTAKMRGMNSIINKTISTVLFTLTKFSSKNSSSKSGKTNSPSSRVLETSKKVDF